MYTWCIFDGCMIFFHTHNNWFLKLWGVHPTLRNINLHNIMYSLISRNPREWMFLVQISLLIVTLLSLVSRFFCHWSKPSKKSIHTLALRRVLICGVSSSSSSWMLVHAYATSSRKAKWSGPHQRRWEENELKFHSVTCYSKCIVSCIHVNTTKLRNITCALVGTRVI